MTTGSDSLKVGMKGLSLSGMDRALRSYASGPRQSGEGQQHRMVPMVAVAMARLRRECPAGVSRSRARPPERLEGEIVITIRTEAEQVLHWKAFLASGPGSGPHFRPPLPPARHPELGSGPISPPVRST